MSNSNIRQQVTTIIIIFIYCRANQHANYPRILRIRPYLLHRRVPLGQSMNFIYVVNGFYYAVIKYYT